MQACRDALHSIGRRSGKAAHAGLLLSRYLRETGRQEKDAGQNHKKDILQSARQAVTVARPLYEHCFHRWLSCLPQSPPPIELSVNGRMIIGLGSDNVLETGITLHHTYGVPLIPGSALKGLAAHFCNQIWGAADSRFQKRGEYYKILFGANDDSGHIVFHDAWIDPASLTGRDDLGLVLDVMTPHHGEYYSGEKDAPGDFDDPNPIQFISVSGKFLLPVAADVDSEEGRRWAQLALDLLQEALAAWGVGGKTSSGYGRLRPATAQSAGVAESSITQKPSGKPAALGYKRGDRIWVKRIEDTVSHAKVRYQAVDGAIGHFSKVEPPPNIPVGESVEVWVANVGAGTYMLTLKKPALSQERSFRGKKGNRR